MLARDPVASSNLTSYLTTYWYHIEVAAGTGHWAWSLSLSLTPGTAQQFDFKVGGTPVRTSGVEPILPGRLTVGLDGDHHSDSHEYYSRDAWL